MPSAHPKITSQFAPPRPRRAAASRLGFTLVEAMVAMVVVGVVLTAAFSTVAQGVRTMERARDYTRVAQILQSEMEDLRTYSWADLETATTSGFVAVALAADFVEEYGDRYTVERWIRDRHSDQKEISVRVIWSDGRGGTITKMTTTWFTENGMNDYYYRSF